MTLALAILDLLLILGLASAGFWLAWRLDHESRKVNARMDRTHSLTQCCFSQIKMMDARAKNKPA